MNKLFPVLYVFSCLIAAQSFAGSATWSANPVSGDWNTAANWVPQTVPNGSQDVASLGMSNLASLTFSANTLLNGIVFNAGAGGYTLVLPTPKNLTVGSGGIVNNSGVLQNFVIGSVAPNLSAYILFTGNATAGSQTIFTNQPNTQFGGGSMIFLNHTTAGNATIVNQGGGFSGEVVFEGESTSGGSIITCEGGTGNFGEGGRVTFIENSGAGRSNITLEGGAVSGAGGGQVYFLDDSRADQSRFVINGGRLQDDGLFSLRASLFFLESSSAEGGTFTVNGGTGEGATGGEIAFNDTSMAGNATFIINGGINGGDGGMLQIRSDGEQARLKLFKNGALDVSAGSTRLSIRTGSIEGDGIIFLGSSSLTVGENNLSTIFSGEAHDVGPAGGTGGSLTKVGAGTLTLSGTTNTYTGVTTVSAGTLLVKNAAGSATGAGAVQVSGGTLGGRGIIGGKVNVGTGAGGGAVIAPSHGASNPTTLTVNNLLTFKADGSYLYRLNTNKGTADQVIAEGVTIGSGAQFNFKIVGSKKLSTGTVFTVISNTATTPISGTFANLADGSTVTLGRNKLQVNYSGGDGNDLTLTVVP